MEIWFLVKNNLAAKPSLIKVSKTNIILITPVILNEDLNLEEIQFSGTETPLAIQFYLSKYFKSIKNVSSYQEGLSILNLLDEPKVNRTKITLLNIFAPGLGFFHLGYYYSSILLFILTLAGFYFEPFLALMLYLSIIAISVFSSYTK